LVTIHAQAGFDLFEAFTILNAAAHTGNGWLLGILSIAAGTVLLLPKIGHAHSAIHAAGSDEKGSDLCCLVHKVIIWFWDIKYNSIEMDDSAGILEFD
jgi:hypothetical protein